MQDIRISQLIACSKAARVYIVPRSEEVRGNDSQVVASRSITRMCVACVYVCVSVSVFVCGGSSFDANFDFSLHKFRLYTIGGLVSALRI